jgi:hypothetical protein
LRLNDSDAKGFKVCVIIDLNYGEKQRHVSDMVTKQRLVTVAVPLCSSTNWEGLMVPLSDGDVQLHTSAASIHHVCAMQCSI